MKMLEEIAQFLNSRVTAILFGALLAAAFSEATFVHPSLVERICIILSSLILGWFFSFKYHEFYIAKGKKEFIEDTKWDNREHTPKETI